MGGAMKEKFLMSVVKRCSKKLKSKPKNHKCIATMGIAAIEIYREAFKHG